MTEAIFHVRVLNSLLYIRDAAASSPPEVDGNGAVWATTDCVVISCLPDSEGETEIRIGASPDRPIGTSLLFDGMLNTPNGEVLVENVLGQVIARRPVTQFAVHLRIWTNGHRATNIVVIAIT
jgi:hypothetical protein